MAVATVGRSVAVEEDEPYAQVKTELVLSSVLKGKTRERAVSLYHYQWPEEEASRLRPGDRVLAFLEPREAEHGGPAGEGYVAADPSLGAARLTGEELEAYRRQTEALARLTRTGAHPTDLVKWMVATAADPLTRKAAVQDLKRSARGAGGARRAARHAGRAPDRAGPPGGDRPLPRRGRVVGGETVPAVLGDFLTDAQKERLSEALLATKSSTEADLDLFRLVRRLGREGGAPLVHRPVPGRASPRREPAGPEGDDTPRRGVARRRPEAPSAGGRRGGLHGLHEAFWQTEPGEEEERLHEAKVAAVEKELRRKVPAGLDEKP